MNITLACVSTVLSVSLIIGALEYYHWRTAKKGANWHDPMTQFDPLLGWSLIPDAQVETWGGIRSNALGARSKPVAQDTAISVFIGDSVTFGYGMPDGDAFVSILSGLVEGRGEQLQNFAVSGYGIDQYYLQLTRVVEQLPAIRRVFLVIFTGNDFIDSSTNMRWRKRKPLFVPNGDALTLVDSPISRFCLRNALANSYFFELLAPHIERHVNIAWAMPHTPDGVEVMDETILQPGKFRRLLGDRQLGISETRVVVVRLLKRIASLAQSRGIELQIILSPGGADLTREQGNHQLFRDILTEANLPFSDLHAHLRASGIPAEELYRSEFEDYAHYSKRGNAIVADFLFERFFSK